MGSSYVGDEGENFFCLGAGREGYVVCSGVFFFGGGHFCLHLSAPYFTLLNKRVSFPREAVCKREFFYHIFQIHVLHYGIMGGFFETEKNFESFDLPDIMYLFF